MMNLQQITDRRNRFIDSVESYLWDRDGRMTGESSTVRAAMVTLFHDAFLEGTMFDDIESPPASKFGHTHSTQCADLHEAAELRSFIVGDVLDLGSGDGRVVAFGRGLDPAIPMFGIEAAEIPRHPLIPPFGMHAGWDQWLTTGDFLDPAVSFDRYGTLYYHFQGAIEQDKLAAKIASWTGRLIVYSRSATPEDVLAWIDVCGGTIVKAWPAQSLVAADVA